jgi:hypothetical protein
MRTCPKCNGSLVFNARDGRLECDACKWWRDPLSGIASTKAKRHETRVASKCPTGEAFQWDGSKMSELLEFCDARVSNVPEQDYPQVLIYDDHTLSFEVLRPMQWVVKMNGKVQVGLSQSRFEECFDVLPVTID